MIKDRIQNGKLQKVAAGYCVENAEGNSQGYQKDG